MGDIQGCLEPLERLLRESGFNPDRHRLIPLGDTINRGPDNLGVLKLLRRLGAEPILGNHEAKILSAVRGLERPQWLERQTVSQDLLRSPEHEAWFEWIATWPLFRRGEGWLAVHAGLHPILPLEQTPSRFLLSVRICDAEGNLPVGWDGLNDTFPPGFRPWHEFYHGDEVVISGHWARQGLHRTPNTRGLDSGCVYGGPLTGLWYPEDRIVQVPHRPG